MPIASRSGTRSATRPHWRVCDRPQSRSGPRSSPRQNAFRQLESALRALIRFHQSHPDWFPPLSGGTGNVLPTTLDPEREAAIHRAYGSAPPADSPPKT